MRVLIIVGLLLGAPEVQPAAKKKPLPVVKEWAGRISPKQAKAEPKDFYVSGPKEFEKLWKEWKLAGRPPAIDWKKNIVLAVTCPGSRMSATPVLTEKGDLEMHIEATDDLRTDVGFRILVISSAGVKTIAGKVPKFVLRPEEP